MAKTKLCEACGYAPTALNPLKPAKDGAKVHRSHFTDTNSKYFGRGK